MRAVSFLFASVVFAFSAFFISPIYAQDNAHHQLYCDKNDSTAATATCLKKHMDTAQGRLNKAYDTLAASVSEQALEDLRNLQRNWLDYRDSECNWESDLTENKALRHLTELSCMARMTEDRADLIALSLVTLGHGGEEPVQYGSFPRWMNVLTQDKPDIFWRYGRRLRGDLTCDGAEEMIMSGISLAEQSPRLIVAIADTPPTGRPKAYFVDLPVNPADSNVPFICSAAPSLIVDPGLPVSDPAGTGDEERPGVDAARCSARLILRHKNCADVALGWTGSAFTLIQDGDGSDAALSNSQQVE